MTPTISPESVAEITTWKNNCAVSCTAIFLVDAFLAGKLSARAQQNLLHAFNDYYQVSISMGQLQQLFLDTFTLPADRQIVLGQVLRNFVHAHGVELEPDNMLSNESFEPLAKEFEFNVTFFADLDGKIRQSGAIPEITIDRSFPLILRPYYHSRHYDLIMDPEAALKHNSMGFEISPHNLPIETAKDEQFKTDITRIIRHTLHITTPPPSPHHSAPIPFTATTPVLNGLLTTILESAKLLSDLSKDIAEMSPDVSVYAESLAASIQQKCHDLQKRMEISGKTLDREVTLRAFKHEIIDLIHQSNSVLLESEITREILNGILTAIETPKTLDIAISKNHISKNIN